MVDRTVPALMKNGVRLDAERLETERIVQAPRRIVAVDERQGQATHVSQRAGVFDQVGRQQAPDAGALLRSA